MIDDIIIDQITQHAERVFPNECCGLVLDNGGLLQYVEAENQSPTPEQSFLIDPVFYAQAANRVVIVVHSHPNRSPEPSEADKASSERANVPFLIMGYPSCDIQCYYPDGYTADYEGRQFVYGIFDCFGLVKDFYQNELNINLPDRERPPYGWWHDKAVNSCIIADYKKWGFERVDSPQHGDVVVVQLQGVIPNHVAVYLEGGLIVHQTLNNISKQEQYGNYWRKNTICYLRHHEKN